MQSLVELKLAVGMGELDYILYTVIIEISKHKFQRFNDVLPTFLATLTCGV